MSQASEALQKQIDDATRLKNQWDAELIKLNQSLLTAKFGKKNEIKKAIRNAEQQIKDYNRQIKKLNDDLASLLKVEVKHQDDVILAEKGIDPKKEMFDAFGNAVQSLVPALTGTLNSGKRAADATTETITQSKSFFKDNITYILIGVALLIFILFKKK